MVNGSILFSQIKHIEDQMIEKTKLQTVDNFCQRSFKEVINGMCRYCIHFKKTTCSPQIEAVVNETTFSISFDGHKCFMSCDEVHLAEKIENATGIILTGKEE
jgi:hypothetical protein